MEKNAFLINSDFHVHTISSGHAYSTLYENVLYAKKHNVNTIAITDHGSSMTNAPFLGHFENASRVPNIIEDVQVLFGCEANIVDCDGTLDLPDNLLKNLDIVLACIHPKTPYSTNDINENTLAIINCMKSKKIDIITHPYSRYFPTKIEDIVLASIEYDVFLEINYSLLIRSIYSNDVVTISKMQKMVDLLNSNKRGYIINSDAHICTEIGISSDKLKTIQDYLNICVNNIVNDVIKTFNGKCFRF